MLYDKKGYPIHEGDILKVFHFRLRHQKKRHYMYKQAGEYTDGSNNVTNTPYLVMKHLPIVDATVLGEGYYVLKDDGRLMMDYEIIQGHGPDDVFNYTQRKKRK